MSALKMTNVLIWDEDGKPSVTASITILWRAFPSAHLPNIVSVPDLVELYADQIKSNYLEYVYTLGQTKIDGKLLVDHFNVHSGLNLWWSSLVSEKSNWTKSPEILNAIRVLAFSKWFESNPFSDLTLSTTDNTLASALDIWCSTRNISFTRIPSTSTPIRVKTTKSLLGFLPLPILSLLWLTRYCIKRWHLKGVGLDSWNSTQNHITFVSYLFNSPRDSITSGRFETPYWCELVQYLQNNGYSSNWLHIYISDNVLPTSLSAAKALTHINSCSNNQVHTTLDSFLSFDLVLKTLLDWLCLAIRSYNLESKINSNVSRPELWIFLKNSFTRSLLGPQAIKNALYARQFKAAVASLQPKSACFYLQENTDWESFLIQNWRLASQGKIIGVPHSSIRFWDLRYFNDNRIFRYMPHPDLIAVNGPKAKSMLVEGGYSIDQLVDVEALRYLYLSTQSLTHQSSSSFHSSSPLRLLLFGDYLERHNTSMFNLLSSLNSDLVNIISITVKPHPACPIEPTDYPQLNLNVVSSPLPSPLSSTDIALTSSLTSAALDAYCSGIRVISVIDPFQFNLSPLRGHSDVTFVSTALELEQALKKPARFVSSNASDIFHLDPQLSKWSKLLSDLRLLT